MPISSLFIYFNFSFYGYFVFCVSKLSVENRIPPIIPRHTRITAKLFRQMVPSVSYRMTSPVIKRRKRLPLSEQDAPDQDKATRISFGRRCGSFLSDSAVERYIAGSHGECRNLAKRLTDLRSGEPERQSAGRNFLCE